MNNLVTSLTVYNGDLIAGGSFTTADGNVANYIARWDGSTWQQLGLGTNSFVLDMEIYNGELVAGGSFPIAGGVTVNRIARWDGSTWQPLGSGMNAYVETLTVYGGALIAGGNFTTAGGKSAYHIAAWNKPPETCCLGRVGNANGVGGDEPTISDISVVIDALFISGDPSVIVCLAEADINQSGGVDPIASDITIGDISYLIDYLFITGPSLGLPECL
jgi:hypothetical protein